tara:strand:+ start:664 stop:795 length:132 start_codon:yes stop_codon:yes gene_type:complete
MTDVELIETDDEGVVTAALADDADIDAIRTKLKQIMIWLESIK